MAPDVAAAEERRRPEGTDPACPVEDPAPSGTHEVRAGLRQATWAPRAGASPGLSTLEARGRFGRVKLNAVKAELRRAELAFLAASRSLPTLRARRAAGRIADALGRASRAIDGVAKGAAVHAAAGALEGVSRFDPADRPGDFVRLSGKSVALAGKAMARCGFDSVEYWGRTLGRLARVFAATRFSSPA